MMTLETKQHLINLAETLGVRSDWHEPDEQGVTAKCVGRKFDNAGFDDEKHIIITQEGGEEYRINLATLLAIASEAS